MPITKLNFTGVEVPDSMTKADVIRTARNPAVRIKLDQMFGEGHWDAAQVIGYIQDPEREAVMARRAANERRKSADERLQNYLQAYENVTPNDMAMFENMVGIEMRMESVRRDLDAVGTPAEISDLADSLKTLSGEHRQIQSILGIGRAKRGEQYNLQAEMDNFLKASEELILSRMTPIQCPLCKSEIDLGFILFHFRDNMPWSFMFNCPRCDKLVTLTGVVDFDVSPIIGATHAAVLTLPQVPAGILASSPEVPEGGASV